MYNVAIIGAGPAGIFSALEIIKLRPDWKIVLIEISPIDYLIILMYRSDVV